MNENETEQYQFQLDQVEHALESDPTNDELLKLQQDLKELIALTTQYEEQAGATNTLSKNNLTPTQSRKCSRSPSSPSSLPPSALVTHQFSVGQDVKAKWSQDGQYYKATITAIGGADQIFSVQFRGYKDIEVVPLADIEAYEKDKRKKGIFEGIKVGSSGGGRDSDTSSWAASPSSVGNHGVGSNDDANSKKKKVKKVSEVEVKKNAWLNFAKGSDKKKIKKKALPFNKNSIFKTPDNPESKVGVVGSGRGMTSYQHRGKHNFVNSVDDE